MLSMLLCCAMLVSTAFGAEAKCVQVGDIIITSDAPNEAANSLSRAGGKVFLNTSASCTSSRPFAFSGDCKPTYGDTLGVRIKNTGDTDFKVSLTITASNGETAVLTEILTPEEPDYTQTAYSNTDEGLTCSFSIRITPRVSGETAHFDIYVSQYQDQ